MRSCITSVGARVGFRRARRQQRAQPGLVHRLDKGTSGVLVIAKTEAAHRHLSRQFRVHSVHRVYLALVTGVLRRGGVIDEALGRDTRDGRRVSARSAVPRRAVTEYRVAERLGPTPRSSTCAHGRAACIRSACT